jgi:hypothetical protein
MALGVALTLAGGALGCGDDEPTTGTVVVDWQVPIGCSVANIDTVEIRVVELDDTVTGTVLLETPRACSHQAPAELTDLPPATVRIEVEGFNSENKGTYFGSVTGVKIRAGKTVEAGVVTLTQKKSAIDVDWMFANGKLCSANNVSSVLLSIFDSSSVQVFETELAEPFPCDPASSLTLEERTLGTNPEPLRPINGILLGSLNPGGYHLYAFGLDEFGDKVMKSSAFVDTALGEVFPVTLSFVPCSDLDVPPSCE